jgi:hypothetical protein
VLIITLGMMGMMFQFCNEDNMSIMFNIALIAYFEIMKGRRSTCNVLTCPDLRSNTHLPTWEIKLTCHGN